MLYFQLFRVNVCFLLAYIKTKLYFYISLKQQLKITIMKAKLEQELKDLQSALENNLISVNEYQDSYYAISQKLKRL